eukprot:2170720-Pleurochrysis_carterae.AAC.4
MYLRSALRSAPQVLDHSRRTWLPLPDTPPTQSYPAQVRPAPALAFTSTTVAVVVTQDSHFPPDARGSHSKVDPEKESLYNCTRRALCLVLTGTVCGLVVSHGTF